MFYAPILCFALSTRKRENILAKSNETAFVDVILCYIRGTMHHLSSDHGACRFFLCCIYNHIHNQIFNVTLSTNNKVVAVCRYSRNLKPWVMSNDEATHTHSNLQPRNGKLCTSPTMRLDQNELATRQAPSTSQPCHCSANTLLLRALRPLQSQPRSFKFSI